MTSELEDKLATLRTEHDLLLAQIPSAQEAVRRTLHERELAQARHSSAVIKVNRACGYGEGKPGTISVVLRDLLYEERKIYDAAGLALTKARQHLAQLQWELSCRSDDIATLDRMLYPPKPPIISDPPNANDKRTSQQGDSADVIVFPSGNPRAA